MIYRMFNERGEYQQFFKEANNLLELKKLYNEYNKKFFNNSLRVNIKIDGNHFKSSFVLGEYVPHIETIFINKNNLPIEALSLILLHEMIHVYNVQVEGLDPAIDEIHGQTFHNKRNEINKYLKYPIPHKEDLASIDSLLDSLGY